MVKKRRKKKIIIIVHLPAVRHTFSLSVLSLPTVRQLFSSRCRHGEVRGGSRDDLPEMLRQGRRNSRDGGWVDMKKEETARGEEKLMLVLVTPHDKRH